LQWNVLKVGWPIDGKFSARMQSVGHSSKAKSYHAGFPLTWKTWKSWDTPGILLTWKTQGKLLEFRFFPGTLFELTTQFSFRTQFVIKWRGKGPI
jgi:hypothetical protein